MLYPGFGDRDEPLISPEAHNDPTEVTTACTLEHLDPCIVLSEVFSYTARTDFDCTVLAVAEGCQLWRFY